MSEFLEIPASQLSAEILQAIIEEFITREGTDYGQENYSLGEKVDQIKRQLDSGRVVISYDPVTESCSLLLKN